MLEIAYIAGTEVIKVILMRTQNKRGVEKALILENT